MLVLRHDPARGAGQKSQPEPEHGQSGVGFADATDLPRLTCNDKQLHLTKHVTQKHFFGNAVLAWQVLRYGIDVSQETFIFLNDGQLLVAGIHGSTGPVRNWRTPPPFPG